jgi:hypothetical protein
MVKFLGPLLMLFTTSGCCELFGLCTSVNVHTSASSPNRVVSADPHDNLASSTWQTIALGQPGLRPAGVSINNQHEPTRIENNFAACG